MMMNQRINVLGVGISPIHMNSALEFLDSSLQKKDKGYVCVTGVHGIMEAQKDPEFKKILNRSLLNTPDGMPTVWVGKLQGFSKVNRVYGPDLMLKVCEMSVLKNYTHFLYGGNPGVAEKLKTSLESRYPGIRVLGTFTPPFRNLNETEESQLTAQVAQLKPDFFWVGLSTPKQEKFSARYLPQLEAKIFISVGAAFDIHTGRILDSPTWVKKTGLQWFHRLIQEPGRLWKRYLINNPKFLYMMGMQLLGIKRYEIPK